MGRASTNRRDAASLRLLTLNLWGIEPPLRDRLALAESQLRELEPDVIGLQEVRPMDGARGPTTADHLADALGYHRVYEVAVEWDDDAAYPGHAGGEEGLAILSRWPLVEHRALRLPQPRPTEARILLSACIAMPSGPI
ncbi:MAG: endonuclease/exonuclease/phosphatase family protein, partial [Myxococcota bacterium]